MSRTNKTYFFFRVVFILSIALMVSLFGLMKDVEKSQPPNQEIASDTKTKSSEAEHHEHESHLPDLSKLSEERREVEEIQASDEQLFPPAKDVSKVDPMSVSKDKIVFERFTLDELRNEENLPSINSALIARGDFPKENPQQAANPEAHERYLLDKRIHESKYMALHKVTERNRFWKMYQDAKDPKERELFLSSARYHARLALKAQKRYQEAMSAREALE